MKKPRKSLAAIATTATAASAATMVLVASSSSVFPMVEASFVRGGAGNGGGKRQAVSSSSSLATTVESSLSKLSASLLELPPLSEHDSPSLSASSVVVTTEIKTLESDIAKRQESRQQQHLLDPSDKEGDFKRQSAVLSRRSLQRVASPDANNNNSNNDEEVRSLEEEGGDDEGNNNSNGSGSYWWHENTPDEKDVAYVFHDIQSFSSPGALDNNNDDNNNDSSVHDKNNKPKNALDDGQIAYSPNSNAGDDASNMNAMSSSSNNNNNNAAASVNSFTVYSINVDNNPDVSELPHRQPSRTPTPRPTRVPTSSPTNHPTTSPTVMMLQQYSSGASAPTQEIGGHYFPLWSDTLKGCTHSTLPPAQYTLSPEMISTYLYDTKSDCCQNWFGDAYDKCMGDVLVEDLHLDMNTMMMESDYANDNGGGSNSNTNWSYDGPSSPNNNNDNNPQPNPPSPPPTTPPVPTPAEEEEEVIPVTPAPQQPQPQPPSFTVIEPIQDDDGGEEEPTNVVTITPPPTEAAFIFTPPPTASNVFVVTPPPTAGAIVVPTTPTAPTTPIIITDFPTFDIDNNANLEVESTPWPTWSDTTFPTPLLVFEVTARPTVDPDAVVDDENNSDGGSTPITVPTQSPNPPPVFEQFFRPTASPLAAAGNGDNDGDGGGDGDGDMNAQAAQLMAASTATTATTTPIIITPASKTHPIAYSTTTMLYSESFESGSVDTSNSNRYFSWSLSTTAATSNTATTTPEGQGGDDQEEEEFLWKVTSLPDNLQSFDTSRHVVQSPNLKSFSSSSSSTISLTIGDDGSDTNSNARSITSVLESLKHGAYLSFAMNVNVASPLDVLSLQLDDEVIHTWEKSTLLSLSSSSLSSIGNGGDDNNEDAWQVVSTYLPPTTTTTHTFTWTYQYSGLDSTNGAVDTPNGWTGQCQLDAVVIEALTGDVDVSDEALEEIATGQVQFSQGVIPSLDLMAAGGSSSSGSGVGWNVVYDGQVGGYVLLASTMLAVEGANNGSTQDEEEGDNYHGQAGMSFTIITGSNGGVVSFSLFSSVHTPLDVLEISVDGKNLIAATGISSEWENQVLELTPGKHVVAFRHIVNPANMPFDVLDHMSRPDGYEGVSMLRGLKYSDNSVLVEESTSSSSEKKKEEVEAETSSPTEVPTAAPSKDAIAEMSQAVQEKVITITIAAQNYCGRTSDDMYEKCSEDGVLTCNTGDPACPSGTVCFGNIECQKEITISTGISSSTTSTGSPTAAVTSVSPTQPPTLSPTSSPTTDATPVSTTETPVSSESPTVSSNGDEEGDGINGNDDTEECPEGTNPVPGLAGCCVPDPSFLGDGACDPWSPYNTQACAYDLGDCCRESCNPDTVFGCNAKEGDEYGPFGFFCLDPQFSKINENTCNVENREWIGDGGCDPDFNIPECGYDNGDCCRQTCDVEKAYFECGNAHQPFDCKDPDVIYRADYVP